MDFINKQFIDILEWTEAGDGTLAWRFPVVGNEIQTGASLTVRLRAFGNYAYRISDAKLFYTQMSGTRDRNGVDDLDGQLRSLMLQHISDAVAQSGLPFLDLVANQVENCSATEAGHRGRLRPSAADAAKRDDAKSPATRWTSALALRWAG